MPRTRTQLNVEVVREGSFWILRKLQCSIEPEGLARRRGAKPSWIGPATGPYRLTKAQAQLIASEQMRSRVEQKPPEPKSAMTVAEFVTSRFVPAHVAMKTPSGRTHYQAMLKHVISPEAVDQAFQADSGNSRTKLKALANWPYLNDVRLADARPDDVQRLVAAALARGYSAQTATHIRNTVRAIFSHAQKEGCFSLENPASHVTPPEMIRRDSYALTLPQAKAVLAAMHYPDKEIALFAILTSMNVAEICGLQWKQVNLTEGWANAAGEAIPPWTIARRKPLSSRRLAAGRIPGRIMNLPITGALRSVLLRLNERPGFTGPDDFVLVSSDGAPISPQHFASRRLKTIGRELQMPCLTWQVFRRTHRTLAQELGLQGIAHACFEIDRVETGVKMQKALTFSASA